MKLISMTDFVIKESLKVDDYKSKEISYQKLENYAFFLKRKLELEMFVPCDFDGNVLEQFNEICFKIIDYNSTLNYYEKSKQKVLFEGFQYCEKSNTIINQDFIFIEKMIKDFTIEDLIEFDLTLTEHAINALGL